MRILFSPIGDTDPIRGFRDGAMLHIIRHYKPDKVVLFLTQDMVAKEEKDGLYSRAIGHLRPDLELELYRTQLTEPQDYDALAELSELFAKVRSAHSEAEIIINLSSGTPQMKTVMALIAIDHPEVKAVQVVSPEKGSNRHNHPNAGHDSIEDIIATNEDDDICSVNRCSEPRLMALRRYRLRHQLLELIEAYEYHAAMRLFAKLRMLWAPDDRLAEEIGNLLKHAAAREDLRYEDAVRCCNMRELTPYGKKKDVQKLNEYLMVMELRQKKEQIPEFVVKILPFLDEILFYYLQQGVHYDLSKIAIKRGGQWKYSSECLRRNEPELWHYFDKSFGGGFRDGTALSYNNMALLLEVKKFNPDLTRLLMEIKPALAQIRNSVAHTIVNYSEQELLKVVGLSSQAILHKLKNIFTLIMAGEKCFQQRNVYEVINIKLREKIVDSK